jgi:hypothetical protein
METKHRKSRRLASGLMVRLAYGRVAVWLSKMRSHGSATRIRVVPQRFPLC